MNRSTRSLLILGSATALGALAVLAARRTARPELEVVPDLELERYMGRWYEIASIPVRHEEGCTAVTADYRLHDDGTVAIRNHCLRDARPETVHGIATPVDDSGARLKVRFSGVPVLRANYCVLAVGERYQWALVGTPDRRHAWILSRGPSLDVDTVQDLLHELERQGFDTSRMRSTPQPLGHVEAVRNAVDEASWESFPASDAPGWTSQRS